MVASVIFSKEKYIKRARERWDWKRGDWQKSREIEKRGGEERDWESDEETDQIKRLLESAWLFITHFIFK
jgi:hypothetical protein